MDLNEAIKQRINELLQKQNITLTALCLNSNLTPSTVFDFMAGKSKPEGGHNQKIVYGRKYHLTGVFQSRLFQ